MSLQESLKSPSLKSPTTPLTPNTGSATKDSLKDYKIVKNIGEGAFGEVYLAKSRATDQLFAIKSISKNFLMKQKKEHHVFQERLILQMCDFPFLVRLYKTFQDDSKIYFVLENIPNGELSKYIRKRSTLIRMPQFPRLQVYYCRNRADTRGTPLQRHHTQRY
jgi:serine/threonine protein kinase